MTLDDIMGLSPVIAVVGIADAATAAPLAFGLAAAALKHSVAGDFNLVSAAEVRALVEGGGLDVKR